MRSLLNRGSSDEESASEASALADLVEALRRQGVREIDTSRRRRAEYSSDASNYRLVPAAVVYPQHVDEVLAALTVARESGVALTSRGGGTSTSGNSIGTGIVVDFSRHLNNVVSVDPTERVAVVEPGTILDTITAAAAPFGLRFGPDPSTHARATIGGALGNNACGARALRYGRTADNVVALDFLAGDGARLSACRIGESGLSGLGGIAAALDTLAADNSALIRAEFGRFIRQISGYSMEHLLPENGADLARFLVGTEGTLGVILGATVSLVESPKAVALAVLGYEDMAAAADDVLALIPHRPVALEGMDAHLVEVFRSRVGDAAIPPLPKGGGWLFIETEGADLPEAEANARRVIADASCLDSAVVTGAPARALWRVREDGAGLASRTLANDPAWPGWEDSAVPPENLGSYLRDLDGLMHDFRLSGVLFGHFGDGCVHARLDFPLANDPAQFREFIFGAAQLAGRYGGSMSGEHGDGRARGELLPFMYSAEAIRLFGKVKGIFDGGNVCNPGVIVDPVPIDADLRLPRAHSVRVNLGFSYGEDKGDFAAAVHRCVGVGKCRANNTAAGGVMCPSYLATRDEKDSTRGRARVLQEVSNGSLVHGFDSPEVLEALDLCLSCKGCSVDCPAAVDMATYKAEALYQRYRGRLRPLSHYSLGWIPESSRLASLAPRLANAVLGSRRLKPLISKLSGIDRHRNLPRFAPATFRKWFSDHHVPKGDPVLLWVDSFTEFFTPQVGQAAVTVLEDAGYAVEVISSRVCCGLTWISTGQLDVARRQLLHTLDALDPFLKRGIPIVGLEPSCTAVLRKDLHELLPNDPRSARATRAVRTLAELLDETAQWSPPDLSGVEVVAQPHCHQHAVMGWDVDQRILAKAGAIVHAVGGCCGFAGNFGLEAGHYDVSVKIAETTLLPAVRSASDDAVMLADGFSCRTQLAELAPKDGTHLAELLAQHLGQERHIRD